MENTLTWGEIEADQEIVTEDDLAGAMSMGKMPAGKFLCTCIESSPKHVNLSAYTALAANLKFKVDQVYEIAGKPVDPDKWSHLENKFIWDDVFMPHPDEKDGMRNRRVLIANRMGILKNGKLTKDSWAKDIIGRKIILTLIDNEWNDKQTGQLKKNVKVDFSGYEEVQGGNTNAAAGGNSYSDI